MAGNPYTESGEKFQIPDMLANRADTYNLGDILDGREEAFALSYIENSLTSNPVLAPLTTRDQEDLYKLVRMAAGDDVQADQLSHPYSGVELRELLTVLEKLTRIQKVLLQVNMQYIYSAAQDDAYRTEPRFQLQGSYRNMNKMAEKVLAVMNDAELEALVDDHYQGEAQALTTGAEQNLLKLAELRGRMTPAQQERWTEIKEGFRRRKSMGSGEDDPVTRVTGTLGLLSEKLGDIGQSIEEASKAVEADRAQTAESNQIQAMLLEKLEENLTARTSGTATPAATAPVTPAISPAVVAQVSEQLAALSHGMQSIVAAIESHPTTVAVAAGAPASTVAPPPTGGPVSARPVPQGQTAAAPRLPVPLRQQLDQISSTMDIRIVDLLRTIDKKLKQAGMVDPAIDAMLEQALSELSQLRSLVDALKTLDAG